MDLMSYANKLLCDESKMAVLKTSKRYKVRQISKPEDISDVSYIQYSGRYRKTLPMINIREVINSNVSITLDVIVTRILTFISEREKYIHMEVNLNAE